METYCVERLLLLLVVAQLGDNRLVNAQPGYKAMGKMTTLQITIFVSHRTPEIQIFSLNFFKAEEEHTLEGNRRGA